MIRIVKNNDFNISYKTEGSGEDILFLHGFPSNIFMWDDISEVLVKNNYRVTSIEQRGYPLSAKQEMNINDFTIDKLAIDIETLINTLDLSNNLTIVSHDWGTVVGWAVLKRKLVSVKNYIGICGGTLFPSHKVYKNLTYYDGEHYISSFQNPLHSANLLDKNIRNTILGAYRTKNTDQNISLSIESLFNDTNHIEYAISGVELDNLANHYKNTGFYGPISWYANLDANIELSEQWSHNKINQNILFMFGEKDMAVKLTENMRQRLNKVADVVKIKEISEAGHWLPYTHKERVLDEIYSLSKGS